MYFHSQNLNDSIPKRYLWHGRCWIGQKPQVNLEWCIPSRSLRFMLNLNDYGDDAFSISFSVFLFSIHVGFDWRPLYRLLEKITKRKDQKYTNGRQVGFYFYSNTFYLMLWNDPDEYRREDPKWWKFRIDFQDLFWGKPIHSKEVLEERTVIIPMPEKSYVGLATLYVQRWTYPRWFTKEFKGCEIKVEEGIPMEGKGENSWDCGRDATYGLSCGAKTIPEAVGKLVGSVLNDRVKYGGWSDYNWQKS